MYYDNSREKNLVIKNKVSFTRNTVAGILQVVEHIGRLEYQSIVESPELKGHYLFS